MIESIRGLSREKCLVIWITHRMPEVVFADRVLFFQSGKNPRLAMHQSLLGDPAYRGLMENPASSPAPAEAPRPGTVSTEEEEAPLLFPL